MVGFDEALLIDCACDWTAESRETSERGGWSELLMAVRAISGCRGLGPAYERPCLESYSAVIDFGRDLQKRGKG